ncbi:MAG: TetR/AcrR family transcriptional regulator [Bacteroidetes bacterium HGW-Bacteroidetes-16]|jgi:AcrR family transcriptional regulator|nr:MAG: TetR/AcrR family transcriptional regulator [Bacteroidetes bacterium HGW-Bacteroidetes-16]
MTELSDRQIEIIEATGKILTASGISGLTIKNLANEMKFSESAIYRHFKSKEEIIIAMLNYLVENIDKRLESVTRSNETPEEKLNTLFRNQLDFFNTNKHFVVVVFSDGLLDESTRIKETIHKLLGVKIKHLMPIIIEGQQKGMFTNAIAAEELMQIFIGSFQLQMFKWRLANFEYDIQRNGNNMVQSVLTVIKSK